MQLLAELDLDIAGVVRLAEALALKLGPGDTVALAGDLGAGKTTFARALIRAMLDEPDAEVPSPTFSLLQTYRTPRGEIAHFDLYRLGDAGEAIEIGLEQALAGAITLIEWPDRATELLPRTCLYIDFAEAAVEACRRLTLRVSGRAEGGDLADRTARAVAVSAYLGKQPGWASARIVHLNGDASTRSYARLHAVRAATDPTPRSAVLMDAPRRPDGPPLRGGLPYSRIARLAEDVRPFVAVAECLSRNGFSAPKLYAHDIDAGLLLLEDFGDRDFGSEVSRAEPQAPLWRAAVDALVELRRRAPGTLDLPLPDGTTYALPRFDRSALEIELDLLLDWYWPEVHGAPAPEPVRAEMQALWAPLLDRLMALPAGWFLRDYHSPNLLWLPEREGIARVGIIDFQDALAEPWEYDLVSLLHDARVDVPRDLELELLACYHEAVACFEPAFDPAQSSFAYHVFGAQRRCRHIGLFVRLLRRDGKAGYLRHIPRAWEHLERCLAHPELAGVADWFRRALPPDRRRLPRGN